MVLLFKNVRDWLFEPPDEKRGPLDDEVPTNLSTQGTLLPLLIGTERLAPIIGSVNGRSVERFTFGKKGKDGGEQYQWSERVWHQLCIGRAEKLWRIERNGVTVFRGPIDRVNHPSGSSFPTADGETFYIFWGEQNQSSPSGTNLPGDLGFTSRFPNTCHVYWDKMIHGPTPTHSTHHYTLEVRVNNPGVPGLQNSSSWIDPGFDDTPDLEWPIDSCGNGPEGNNGGGFTIAVNTEDNETIEIVEKNLFRGSSFRTRKIDGNIHPDRWFVYAIRKESDFDSQGNIFWLYRISTVGGLEDCEDHEFVLLGPNPNLNDGANPAHILNQLLFSEKPHGCRRARGLFDIDSLERMGVICEQEGLYGTVYSTESYKKVISNILSDTGFSLALNPVTGKYTFTPHRKPTSSDTIFSIPFDANTGNYPEMTTRIGRRNADKVDYLFKDRDRNYRLRPINFPNHAQGRDSRTIKTDRVEMFLPRSYSSGYRFASIHAKESNGAFGDIKVEASRGAIDIYPGSVFFVEGNPYPYRCIGNKPLSSETSRTTVRGLLDPFSSGTSAPDSELADDFVPPEGVGEPDRGTHIYEVSAFVVEPDFFNGISTILPLRRRANGQIIGASIYWSEDGSSYQYLGNMPYSNAGGRLLEALPEDGPCLMEDGVLYEPVGFDGLDVEDLTGQDSRWLRGEQLAVVGQELMYIQSVTVESESTARLNGIIRARNGTKQASHIIGEDIYVFSLTQASIFQRPEFLENTTCYFKIVPATSQGSLDISNIQPIIMSFDSPGGNPMDPGNIIFEPNDPTRLARNSYSTGEDSEFFWTYRSRLGWRTGNRSGAGFQGAGVATGQSNPDGFFRVFITDEVGTVKRVVDALFYGGWTYTNANLVADFGGEPDYYKFSVVNYVGGRISPAASLEVVKV